MKFLNFSFLLLAAAAAVIISQNGVACQEEETTTLTPTTTETPVTEVVTSTSSAVASDDTTTTTTSTESTTEKVEKDGEETPTTTTATPTEESEKKDSSDQEAAKPVAADADIEREPKVVDENSKEEEETVVEEKVENEEAKDEKDDDEAGDDDDENEDGVKSRYPPPQQQPPYGQFPSQQRPPMMMMTQHFRDPLTGAIYTRQVPVIPNSRFPGAEMQPPQFPPQFRPPQQQPPQPQHPQFVARPQPTGGESAPAPAFDPLSKFSESQKRQQYYQDRLMNELMQFKRELEVSAARDEDADEPAASDSTETSNDGEHKDDDANRSKYAELQSAIAELKRTLEANQIFNITEVMQSWKAMKSAADESADIAAPSAQSPKSKSNSPINPAIRTLIIVPHQAHAPSHTHAHHGPAYVTGGAPSGVRMMAPAVPNHRLIPQSANPNPNPTPILFIHARRRPSAQQSGESPQSATNYQPQYLDRSMYGSGGEQQIIRRPYPYPPQYPPGESNDYSGSNEIFGY